MVGNLPISHLNPPEKFIPGNLPVLNPINKNTSRKEIYHISEKTHNLATSANGRLIFSGSTLLPSP